MGAQRSQPDLTKMTVSQTKINTNYAIKEMCGWRRFMQDTFIAQDSLTVREDVSLFAIFDGHGGADVAKFACNHFTEELQKHPEFRKNQFQRCLKETFLKMDQMMRTAEGKAQLLKIQQDQHKKGNGQNIQDAEAAGSTALVCLITSNFVYIANAGDSRAICSVNGQLIEMSTDHRPNIQQEAIRIKNAGGWIDHDRVNGDLMVSRGLGDFSFKKNKYQSIQQQIVIASPDVKKIQRKNIDFILMGCDGIWEEKTNQQMKNWIESNLKVKSMQEALDNLLDELVSKQKAGEKGKDNMTAILIKPNNLL